MINNDREFDLITSFQESVEESEITSIGKALELIPDDEDETVWRFNTPEDNTNHLS